MNAKVTRPVPRSKTLGSSRTRSVNSPFRNFCRAIALDPQLVRTTFPNVAALIDELGSR